MLNLSRLLLVLAATLAATPSQLWAQAEERSVYVSVLDKSDKPVTGLSSGDFVVREGGLAREVLRVEPASEPAQIALLIDTSAAVESHVGDIRRALQTFFKELQGKHEVALIGYGERPTVLVNYTRDPKRLESGVGQVFHRSESGTYLLDAIVESARALQKLKAERPVIVVFNARGQEFSERPYKSVTDELKPLPVTLHAFVLTRRGTPAFGDREAQELEMTLAEGTKITGGRREELLTTMAFGDRLRAMLDELNNQYKVTYGRPKALIPPDTLEVSVKRPELTARARQIP